MKNNLLCYGTFVLFVLLLAAIFLLQVSAADPKGLNNNLAETQQPQSNETSTNGNNTTSLVDTLSIPESSPNASQRYESGVYNFLSDLRSLVPKRSPTPTVTLNPTFSPMIELRQTTELSPTLNPEEAKPKASTYPSNTPVQTTEIPEFAPELKISPQTFAFEIVSSGAVIAVISLISLTVVMRQRAQIVRTKKSARRKKRKQTKITARRMQAIERRAK